MSEDEARAPKDPTRDERAAPQGPLPGILPAAGVSELLHRLGEHRARGSRHVVVERIGVGGMGEILKVNDRDLGRDLAMKILRRDATDASPTQQGRMLARFLEEAQITGQLHHPSIVPVHELSIGTDGQPYFTMPLVRGWDFAQIIGFVREEQEGWTLARALGIVLKVCEAAAYAHAHGVIHRDIKPSNVRVGRFGETYLMDWGLARVLGRQDAHDVRVRDGVDSRSTEVRTDRSRLKQETPDSPLVTMDGDVVGTPHYMSPEQGQGLTDRVGPRSDVYSLGALLYHLLSGRAPYSPAEGALSPRAVWSLVLDGAPKDLSEVAPDAPKELIEICRKAMQREPRNRYADARELAADIEAFLVRRPVKAHAPTVGYALRLAYERNRGVITATLVGLGLLLVASALFLLRLSQSRASETRARAERGDSYAATVLLREESDLFPVHPSQVPAMTSWCQRVEDLLSRRHVYEARAADNPQIASLVTQLAGLTGLLPVVRDRLRRSTELPTESIEKHRAAWDEAISDIRSSAIYGGLSVAPQMGLRPLWKDAQSGLWEFLATGSGAAPVAADPGARVAWRTEDGVVLVLIPSGEFSMGSSPDDIAQRIADPNETLRATTVSAFFLQKTEVDQAQWARVMGRNPSRFCPEDTAAGSITLLHPVESVSWDDCMLFCRRLGVRLPSEEEWEYACRAGTTSRYAWGGEPESLEGKENVLDESAIAFASTDPAPWNDGYPFHAPVGSYVPNRFGLLDMLGNVSEWCSDEAVPNPLGLANPTGARCTPAKAIRGGNWNLPPRNSCAPQRTLFPLRCAFRQWDLPYGLTFMRGVRLARSIE